MTTLELAIDAYKSILKAQEPLRHFADFRNYFADEKEDTVPVPLGGGDFQAEAEARGWPRYIHECVCSAREVCGTGIRNLYGCRDSQGAWSGPDSGF